MNLTGPEKFAKIRRELRQKELDSLKLIIQKVMSECPSETVVGELAEALCSYMEEKRKAKYVPPAPRYDDIYFEGVKWLDENG